MYRKRFSSIFFGSFSIIKNKQIWQEDGAKISYLQINSLPDRNKNQFIGIEERDSIHNGTKEKN